MKPCLFNTDMVRAIQEDRKTVTRRVVKPQPKDCDDCHHDMQTYDQMLPQFYKGDYSCVCKKCGYGTEPNGESIFNPPYSPGDILYVRETWVPSTGGIVYKASLPYEMPKWYPSIHMPREAARIFLRVTYVRVERLQDITEEQAVKEGFEAYHSDSGYYEPATLGFVETWNSTIKPADRALYGWDANPWVWVIEFERCEKPEGD